MCSERAPQNKGSKKGKSTCRSRQALLLCFTLFPILLCVAAASDVKMIYKLRLNYPHRPRRKQHSQVEDIPILLPESGLSRRKPEAGDSPFQLAFVTVQKITRVDPERPLLQLIGQQRHSESIQRTAVRSLVNKGMRYSNRCVELMYRECGSVEFWIGLFSSICYQRRFLRDGIP